jgi:hypothetical protein
MQTCPSGFCPVQYLADHPVIDEVCRDPIRATDVGDEQTVSVPYRASAYNPTLEMCRENSFVEMP